MLIKIYDLMEKIEKGIGNKVRVRLGRYDTGLIFYLDWPNGYRMIHKVDTIELEGVYIEDAFVDYLIHLAKKAYSLY